MALVVSLQATAFLPVGKPRSDATLAGANAMDASLIRGLEALKKGIELRETGAPRRSIKSGSTKWNVVKRAIS
jgi:hypothetical protein